MAIAQYLKLSLDEFVQKYLRKVGDRWSLLEHPKTFDCIFLKDKKCQIYSIRPTQCRTYPWWIQNLSSKEAWDKAALECEGIQKGDPVPYEEIDEKLNEQLDYEHWSTTLP